MSFVIESGNSKNKANVNDFSQLETFTVNQSIEQNLTRLGHTYNLNTGDITFTNESENAVTYLKNNEQKSIVISSFIYLIGNSTNGSGDSTIKVYSNPTTGTIITSGVESSPVNRNFGSKNILDVDWKIGDGSHSSSGGTKAIPTRLAVVGRKVIGVTTVLEKGSSLSILYTPPSGNTSQICQFAMAVYLDIYS